MMRIVLAFRKLLGQGGNGTTEVVEEKVIKPVLVSMERRVEQLEGMTKSGDLSEAEQAQKEIEDIAKRKEDIEKAVKRKIFDSIAWKGAQKAVKIVHKHGVKLKPDQVHDVFADFLTMVWERGYAGWIKGFIRKKKHLYNLSIGDIEKLFKSAVSFDMREIASKMLTYRREHQFPEVPGAEGEPMSTMYLVESRPEPLTMEFIKKIRLELNRYIKSKDEPNGILSAMMESCWRFIGDKRATEKNPWYQILKDKKVRSIVQHRGPNKGKPYSESSLEGLYRHLKWLILSFFVEKKNFDLTRELEDFLNVEGKKVRHAKTASERKACAKRLRAMAEYVNCRAAQIAVARLIVGDRFKLEGDFKTPEEMVATLRGKKKTKKGAFVTRRGQFLEGDVDAIV